MSNLTLLCKTAHEQANDVIKGDGGAVGLTEDASALRRRIMAGP